MTLKGGIGSAWHGQAETGSHLAPRPAPLDSSLRWNDGSVRTRFGFAPVPLSWFVSSLRHATPASFMGTPTGM